MRVLFAALCGALAATSWPLERAVAQMDMGTHSSAPLNIPETRTGSGTSWLPDRSPMRAFHFQVGSWKIMLHGAAALALDAQGGPRGTSRLAVLNWVMGEASRSIGSGRLALRTMLSAEPATVGAAGYPLLLQSGESYHGLPLHDRQHPHDLFMEAALLYERPIARSVALSAYLAPAGEPALGPPAFPHRPSAEWDPLAPIGHHWQDGAHVTYGVLTAGVFTHSVKLEWSAFNGREPDENRTNFDFHGRRIDSFAGRVSVNPAAALSLSAWYGYLRSPEALDPGQSVHRLGAAALWTRSLGSAGRWSGTLVYGANVPLARDHWSNSVLLESSIDLDRASSVFGRVEYVRKSAADLAVSAANGLRYDVGEASLGYFRILGRLAGLALGLGARGTVNVVPPSLRSSYGSRLPLGVAVYLDIRPSLMSPMSHATMP